jgi:acyl-CoA dehydrogenase
MSELREALTDAVTRPFRDAAHSAKAADKDGWQQALWAQINDLGLPRILVQEGCGGVGGDWEDAGAILHAAGQYAIPLPLAESMLAEKLAANAGLSLPTGSSTIALEATGKIENGQFSGSLQNVPWGGDIDTLVLTLAQDDHSYTVMLARKDATKIERGCNIAREPRDTLKYDNAPAKIAKLKIDGISPFYCATLLRAAQICGAIEAALHLTIDYAKEREQFGRSISKFQAVQQQLAVFGAESAAASCAARAACRSASHSANKGAHYPGFAIGAAKLRANMAIDVATATAHQIHGAIGFTEEYSLQHFTRRLWAWRSELGNDHYWSALLGKGILERGADNFWPDLTNRDDQCATTGVR